MPTLQTTTLIRGGKAGIRKYIDDRFDEEIHAAPVDNVRICDLGTLLGGKGRFPTLAGKGWTNKQLMEISPTNSIKIANAMVDGASAQTKNFAVVGVISVAKSVSIQAIFDRELSKELTRLLDEATELYVKHLEDNVEIRRGKAGSGTSEKVTGLRAWKVPRHNVSAAGDSHIHAHVMYSTTVFGAETGELGQIDTVSIMQEHARKAQAIADHHIRRGIEALGYKFDLTGELFGINRDLIERASTAHSAVKALQTAVSAELGYQISDEQAWHHWRQIVAGKSDINISQNLVDQIELERNRTGISDPKLEALIGRLQGYLNGDASGENLEHLLDELLAEPATAATVAQFFCKRYEIADPDEFSASVRQACAEGADYSNVDRVVADIADLPTPPNLYTAQALCIKFAGTDGANALLDEVLTDPRILVITNSAGRIYRVALTAQERQEQEIRQMADELIKETTASLDEQLQDLDSPLAVVTGVAGGGKSTALLEARQAWKGRRVWAAARNRMTATETGRAAGSDAVNALSTAALRERIVKGTGPGVGDVLVVDEFALLDHADVHMILKLAKSGVIIKALGDQHQIQPIDNSTSARIVIDVAVRKGAAALEESRRCEAWIEVHDLLREVTTSITPDIKKVNQLINKLDIRVARTPADVAAIYAEAPESSQVATLSNRLRLEIAEALPRPEPPIDTETAKPILSEVVALREGGTVWAGCEVVVRQNVWSDGVSEPLAMTGEIGHVISVDQTGVVVGFHDGRQLSLDRAEAKSVLRVGGAWTGSSAQGQTWNGSSMSAMTGNETKQWAYSTFTRGRNAPIPIVVIDDPNHELTEEEALIEARQILRQVLTHDGLARTIDELRIEAQNNYVKPRNPYETVPELRDEIWGASVSSVVTIDTIDTVSEAEQVDMDKPQRKLTRLEIIEQNQREMERLPGKNTGKDISGTAFEPRLPEQPPLIPPIDGTQLPGQGGIGGLQ